MPGERSIRHLRDRQTRLVSERTERIGKITHDLRQRIAVGCHRRGLCGRRVERKLIALRRRRRELQVAGDERADGSGTIAVEYVGRLARSAAADAWTRAG